jgi:hypothetical protein
MLKLYCEENVETSIDMISEVETCVYEINVMSSSLCKAPGFSKKPDNHGIKCTPILQPHVYENYLQRVKEEEKKEKDTEQLMRLEKKEKNIKNHNNVEDNDEEDDDQVFESKSVDEAVIGDEFESKAKELLESEELIQKLSQSLTDLLQELDADDDQQQQQLENEEEIVTANKIIEKQQESTSFDSDSELLEAEKATTAPSTDDLSSKWKVKVRYLNLKDLEKNLQKSSSSSLNEEDEKALVEKLSQSNEMLASKFSTNKIKVKILTLDQDQATNEDESDLTSTDGLNSILNEYFQSLLKKQQLKQMQLNYNYNYATAYNSLRNNNANEDDDINDEDFDEERMVLF